MYLQLRNGRAGGVSGIRAEDIKAWLAAAVAAEQEDGPQGDMAAIEHWHKFVELIRHIWDHGEIPTQMTWIVMVLIPKGGDDYRGIGLLEPFWKVWPRRFQF